MPTPFRTRGRNHGAARDARQQLGSEANAKRGQAGVERGAQHVEDVEQPRVALLLMGVHEPAEGDHRIVVLQRPGKRRARWHPFLIVVTVRDDLVGEHATARIEVVN